MEIRISRESRVPLHEQISSQLVLLIATGRLRPGETLPGIRAIARSLSVHHNTVSEAMQHLIQWNLVVRRRGARLMVSSSARAAQRADGGDLEDLVAGFVAAVRAGGYGADEVLARVRERLAARGAERILAVSFDGGMRTILEAELRAAMSCPVSACSPDALIANPELGEGALVVAPPGALPRLAAGRPPARAPISIQFTDPAPYLEAVRRLREPSLVALVSVSEVFLEIARGVVGPVASKRHTLLDLHVSDAGAVRVGAADLVFCDVVTARRLPKATGASEVLAYPLLASGCVAAIRRAMGVDER
jgi:DNA-binding transcriptional regulator YhcF (GntR family)